MEKNNLSAVLPIIGVVIGALLTFYAQFFISSRQQESEIRKKAIDLKNEQCVALWKDFADTYQYLYYSGGYSEAKIDIKGLGQHIKKLNIAIIRAEPFISHDGFVNLIKARDTLNKYYHGFEQLGVPPHDEYSDFIKKFEEPMNVTRDVLRREMGLVDLGVVQN